MTPRRFLPALCLAAPALLLLLAAACGGDDPPAFQQGRLTDPRNVPTATPWQQAPQVTIIDPNAIKPISGGGTPIPSVTEASGEPGVCGDTYKIKSGDTLFGIADKCGVNGQDVKDANPDVDPSNLHVGDTVNIPRAVPSTATPTPAASP